MVNFLIFFKKNNFKICMDTLFTMYMPKKERLDKDLVLRVHPSLFRKFQKKCRENYKSVSEAIRELMYQYVQPELKESEGCVNEKEKDRT